ncbi:hypothetical protein JCM11491_000116 [Sporobolomyces phaffii]
MLGRTLAALPLVATCAFAAPTFSSAAAASSSSSSSSFVTLNDRSTNFHVLADGTSYQSGDITANLRWQSSGLLSAGCSESIGIEDCYTMSLSATGDLETRSRAATLARRRRSTDAGGGASSIDRGDTNEWETFAAHDDSDLEAYAAPWNALEAMYWSNALGPSSSTRLLGGRDSDLRKRQDVKKCDSGTGGGGSGNNGNGTSTSTPPAPRQRIELFSWPGARAGETWSFTWKSHQGATSITSKFFHTWQLLRRDCGGGPIVTLDLKGGKAVVSDSTRGCIDCASIDATQVRALSVFVARTIEHHLEVTFGVAGSIDYKAFDVTPTSSRDSGGVLSPATAAAAAGLNVARAPVLTYSAYGDLGDQASLKFGQYRAVTPGLRDVTSFVGDCALSIYLFSDIEARLRETDDRTVSGRPIQQIKPND